MSWASKDVEHLPEGKTVQFRPRGNSMIGKIESGQLVTVAPRQARMPPVGDIVLCKVNGTQYLHLVKAISGQRFQRRKQLWTHQWLDLAQKYLPSLH